MLIRFSLKSKNKFNRLTWNPLSNLVSQVVQFYQKDNFP